MKFSTSNRRAPSRLTLPQRVARGERQRKWIFLSSVFDKLIIVVLAFFVVMLFAQRGDARRYYNDQLRMIVCSIPPGDATGDALRDKFQCGPYRTPVPRGTSTPRPKPRSAPARPTLTGEAALQPSSPRSTPATRPTPSAPARSSYRAPRRTAVVTAPGRVTTRTVTPTSTPTSTPGLLPAVLCSLLGCRTETP